MDFPRGSVALVATAFRVWDGEQTMLALNDRIEINPAICHGKPVVRGTRVMVSQILGALSGGDSIDEVLMDYPSVTSEDLSAVFAFAGSLAQFEDVPYTGRTAAL